MRLGICPYCEKGPRHLVLYVGMDDNEYVCKHCKFESEETDRIDPEILELLVDWARRNKEQMPKDR